MRRVLDLAMAMQVLLWAGCAAPTPQPPKIEGAAATVSQKDIQQVIALVQQSMRLEFGRVFPIDRIKVNKRNQIDVIYHRDTFECWVPVRRIHGVWTPPPVGVWVT
jgi:hypothetical protein